MDGRTASPVLIKNKRRPGEPQKKRQVSCPFATFLINFVLFILKISWQYENPAPNPLEE
jgi:hypothetical protein